MTRPRWIYDPRQSLSESCDSVATLGGKGAVLRMFAAAGLPTPPCFTIATDACREYLARNRRWPDGLWEQLVEAVSELERIAGRSFGQSSPHAPREDQPAQLIASPTPGPQSSSALREVSPRPLLLAVRSGASVSMPGMLLTLLNCGLTLELAESLDDARTWAAYAQFVRDFSAAKGGDLSSPDAVVSGKTRSDCLRLLQRYEIVCGQPFPQDPWELLRQCVSAVFDSWCSQRAVAYRRLNQLEDASGTAVTVQAMLATEAAGVLFSHDPRQPDGDVFVIEAVRGWGDPLVSGRAEPQRYEVPRRGTAFPGCRDGLERPSHVSDSSDAAVPPERERILDASQLRELCALAMRVESLLGGPADVEWGYAAGQAWLFQARRMDQPQIAGQRASVRNEERVRLQSSAREHGTRLWVRHNLGETLAAPTPLTWDLVRRWMSGRGGYGRLYRSFGYAPSRRVCEHGFLELVAGRIYADPDRLAEMFCAGLPLGYDLTALRADPRLLQRGPHALVPERADGWLLFRLPALLWTIWRASQRVRREAVHVVERFEQQVLPRYRIYVQQQRQVNLASLPDSELTALLEQRCKQILDEFAAELLRPAFYAALAMQALETRLVRLLGPQEGSRCARDLVLGLEQPPAAAWQAELYGVAQGRVNVEQFLERFGHRGPDEMELSAPRWREIPDQLQMLTAWLCDAEAADPETLRQRASEERQRVWQSLEQRLADHGASSFLAAVQREARQAQQLLPYRESARHAFLLGYELIRQAVQEIGRRLELGEDVFFLRYGELRQFPEALLGAGLPPRPDAALPTPPERPTEGLHDELRTRRRRWQLLQRLSVPETVDPAHLEVIGAEPRPQAVAGATLQASAVSAGTARGPVCVWSAGRPAYDISAGSVLVCAALDTALTPLLLRAAAVVVERGGLLSHGAIVARQFGIPAVVLPDASQLLREGQVVTVDGDRGCLVCDGDAAP